MRIHILGICGTFMGGVAALAKALGHDVSGSDANVYPPMSVQLESLGIQLHSGYRAQDLEPAPDQIIVGNALSRGNPCVEYMLDKALSYTSGPQWLAEALLGRRTVLAVSGTHGKTTTSALLAWILEFAGKNPGFLVGGIPENFGVSARLGSDPFFVVEADEYDTAFFDKRSKFVHYRPRILIINNIEFDHADIFADLAAIRREFHHLVRTVPAAGTIVVPDRDQEIATLLEMGCWSRLERFGEGAAWSCEALTPDYSGFRVLGRGEPVGEVRWSLIGRHNAENALAAIAAATCAGIDAGVACKAASGFAGARRRLQRLPGGAGISLYDDFAHHPTAIRVTLQAMRQHVGRARLVVVLEPRSNTMKLGVHSQELASALGESDMAFVFRPGGLNWDPAKALAGLGDRARVLDSIDEIVAAVGDFARPGDHVVIMSNGGFGDISRRLLARLGG